MRPTAFYFNEAIRQYDFGSRHPLRPERLKLTMDLMKACGILGDDEVLESSPATVDDLALCHDQVYIDTVEQLSLGDMVPNRLDTGFGSGDNPPFIGMWEASLAYVGATVDAAKAVIADPTVIGVNISGGLHHAMKGRASGFCIFNDPAVAIHHMLTKWDRVAYVDIDLHHGDGVQWFFYSDPRVLTVSLHESGKWLFPGTGDTNEIGVGEGVGTSLNMPFGPGTTDDIWHFAFEEAVMPVLKTFDPGAIFLQMGCDPHYLDPLGHLQMTAEGWAQAVVAIAELGKPLVATGGGGYNLTTVPRMWTLALAALKGVELPDEIPCGYEPKLPLPTLRDNVEIEVDESEGPLVREFAELRVRELQQQLFPHYGLR